MKQPVKQRSEAASEAAYCALAKGTLSDDRTIFLRTHAPLMQTACELSIASGLRAYGVAEFACSQSMASCFP